MFKDDITARYDNRLDRPDASLPWPQPTSTWFGPSFPQGGMDDIEVHPELQHWAIWQNNSFTLWDSGAKRVVDGYPKEIHNDTRDGGFNGMNRTRCGGSIDLSTLIGFIEDKSPGAPWNTTEYAPGLDCEWHIVVPSYTLKMPMAGYAGIAIQFTRFDLGPGASLEILDAHDRPSTGMQDASQWQVLRPGQFYLQRDPQPVGSQTDFRTWVTNGGFLAVPVNESAIETRMALYTQDSPPPRIGLNAAGPMLTSSLDSSSVRIRFRTPATALPGHGYTGFSLRFAVKASSARTQRELTGAFWFNSMGRATATNTFNTTVGGVSTIDPSQTLTRSELLIFPDTLTQSRIQLLIRANMYPRPRTAEEAARIVVNVTSASTGALLASCTGLWLYATGYTGPRCALHTDARDSPLRISYESRGESFISSVAGEYFVETICNNPQSNPTRYTTTTGIITDGSGPFQSYRTDSLCHMLIQPSDPEVSFVAVQFTQLQFAFPERMRGVWDDFIAFYDKPYYNETTTAQGLSGGYDSTAIRVLVQADSVQLPLPEVLSNGPLLLLQFRAYPQSPASAGWSCNYMSFYPPIPSSVRVSGFEPKSSDVLMQQLRRVGSSASGLVYAGIGTGVGPMYSVVDQIRVSAVDKYNVAIQWRFREWYSLFFRWVPSVLADREPDLARELSLFPFPLATTDAAWWTSASGAGYTNSMLTDAILRSIVEYPAVGGELIGFVAPAASGDYQVTVTLVMHAHQGMMAADSGWGVPSRFAGPARVPGAYVDASDSAVRAADQNVYTVAASTTRLHVAAWEAVSDMSSALRLTIPLEYGNFTRVGGMTSALSPLASLVSVLDTPVAPDLIDRLLSLSSPGFSPYLSDSNSTLSLNGPVVAGSGLRVLVVTRDFSGNRMEGLGFGQGAGQVTGVRDDLRSFLSSASTQASPPIVTTFLSWGLYELSMTPTLVANDYVLTVLVAGSDVFGGPFFPIVQPDTTSALQSTFVVAESGLSLLSLQNQGVSLPVGRDLELLVTLRDRFGNPQSLDAAPRDTVEMIWPGHNVRPQARDPLRPWEVRFLVDTIPVGGDTFESSVMRVLINNLPICHDPAAVGGTNFELGINVVLGEVVVTDYVVHPSVQIVFACAAIFCMLLTVVVMCGLHYFRTMDHIRAVSPMFLQLMLVGALIEYATIIPLTMPVVSATSCALEVLLGHGGFFAIFGALFVKVDRVRGIMQGNLIKATKVTDAMLLVRFGLGMLLMLAYYSIWMAVSPPLPSHVQSGLTLYRVCASEQSVFPILILCIEGAFVVWGAYLSASVWSVPYQFGEAKHLLVAIYQVGLVGGLLSMLVRTIVTVPSNQLLLEGIGVLFVTSMVILAMFGPKAKVIMQATQKSRKPFRSHLSTSMVAAQGNLWGGWAGWRRSRASVADTSAKAVVPVIFEEPPARPAVLMSCPEDVENFELLDEGVPGWRGADKSGSSHSVVPSPTSTIQRIDANIADQLVTSDGTVVTLHPHPASPLEQWSDDTATSHAGVTTTEQHGQHADRAHMGTPSQQHPEAAAAVRADPATLHAASSSMSLPWNPDGVLPHARDRSLDSAAGLADRTTPEYESRDVQGDSGDGAGDGGRQLPSPSQAGSSSRPSPDSPRADAPLSAAALSVLDECGFVAPPAAAAAANPAAAIAPSAASPSA